jgi:hypothetical protein
MKRFWTTGCLILTAFAVFSMTGVFAQSAAKTENRAIAPVKEDILKNYLDLSAAAEDQRRDAFGALSPEAKAGVFRFHIALQVATGPA